MLDRLQAEMQCALEGQTQTTSRAGGTDWVVPSVLVYAFFHSLMCMLTVLLIGAFVGNHPLKGWKIADKMRKGEI